MRKTRLIGIIAVGTWLTCACSRTTPTTEAGAPATPTPSQTSSAAPAASASDNPQVAGPALGLVEPPVRMGAPLKLLVKGPTPPPDKGRFKLTVELVAAEPIVVPTRLRLSLPPEAKLVAGASEETLQMPEAGTISREYTLEASGKLSAPVVVMADASDPKGGFGVHAERRYPAEPSPDASGSVSGSRPPVGRPPAPPH